MRVLVDLIIPRDERSGSATDAGVPQFMDFMMIDQPPRGGNSRQTAMRGGLAWIDFECQRRFDKTFVACPATERTAFLDDISKPAAPARQGTSRHAGRVRRRRSLPVLSHGRAFFSSFRDLTATAFWTTKMGIQDLQYMGNRSSRNGTAVLTTR